MTENHDTSARAAAKRSERTCAGCGETAPAEDLVRLILDPSSGEVAVDLGGSAFGRGAHLHPAPGCVAKSLKGGLARVFKSKVVADASVIGADIVKAADRRIEGLLTGARRAGQLALGADVVAQSMREGSVELVVVARDARAATRVPEIERAIASGKAVAFADKQHLGVLMGRGGVGDEAGEVAVIAILHVGVADAVSRAYRMSGPFRASGREQAAEAVSTDRSEEAWSSSPEVR